MTSKVTAASRALLAVLLLAGLPLVSRANHDAKRLYDDLLLKNHNYNKLIRPVGNRSAGLTVRLGLRLAQLIDVDERNEIITTNMWVIQEWEDYGLRWDPFEYGGVDKLYVPSERIWLPDIVLYNNADGDYTVTLMTKATLSFNGMVTWEPPAIYKSHCDINVEFFPFDEQLCDLKFGSWTYDGTHVDLRHIWADKLGLGELDVIENSMDIKNYYRSVEWDLISIPAKKNNKYYPCCSEPYPDITFNITIRRKTLFYTINLLLPCVFINMLTVLVFYLPSDSGEKISLCISILLSLSVFQLLLMEMIPGTSLTIPLMGKYILFTMIMVSLSVFISVITLNVNFRSSATHVMPKLTRTIFLGILPRLLFMKRPLDDEDDGQGDEWCEWADTSGQLTSVGTTGSAHRRKAVRDPREDVENIYGNYAVSSSFVGAQSMWRNTDLSNFCDACANRKYRKYPSNVYKAMDGVLFVAKHLKDDDGCGRVDIRHINADSNAEVTVINGIDIKNFYASAEWDLLAVPAKKTNKYYPCCLEPYPDITFNISLRRKTLFYTINLLVPCLSINMLTCLTFYLPSDSGEKISLCITILLSLSMFQLLLMELIPATSITVPMMGKYILFTMAMVSLSVFISVVTLNVNVRSVATNRMPGWAKTLFFNILPRLLFMKRPDAEDSIEEEQTYWSSHPDWPEPIPLAHTSCEPSQTWRRRHAGRDVDAENAYRGYAVSSTFVGADDVWLSANLPSFCQACMRRRLGSYPNQLQKALEGMAFIEKHHRDDDEQKTIKEDWRYVAVVIDRIFLWVYVTICTIGGASILLNAPILYNQVDPLA